MNPIARLTGLLALAITLPACQDIHAPENLGELSVALDISGAPAADAAFVVGWAGANGSAQGSTPFTARHPRQTFSQVPRGPTTVTLRELPANCAADPKVKTVDVVTSQTREVRFTVECR